MQSYGVFKNEQFLIESYQLFSSGIWSLLSHFVYLKRSIFLFIWKLILANLLNKTKQQQQQQQQQQQKQQQQQQQGKKTNPTQLKSDVVEGQVLKRTAATICLFDFEKKS